MLFPFESCSPFTVNVVLERHSCCEGSRHGARLYWICNHVMAGAPFNGVVDGLLKIVVGVRGMFWCESYIVCIFDGSG